MLPGPREKFSETEINYMKKYLESGGSIFVLLGEGGEKRWVNKQLSKKNLA